MPTRAKTVGSGAHEQLRLPPLPDLLPSALSLTIVCGPPGSGKTTYVRAHAASDDLTIDLDEIQARMTGLNWYKAGPEALLPAILERNRMLQELSSANGCRAAWFVVGAPSRREREHWRQLRPRRMLMVLAPAEECKRRLAADSRRSHLIDHFAAAVDDWWLRYEPERPVVGPISRSSAWCSSPGCRYRQPCPEHSRRPKNQRDRQLDTRAWRRLSAYSRARQPLCEDCLADGCVTPAVDPHHPHRRSEGGALLTDKLVMLCKHHHGVRTARGE